MGLDRVKIIRTLRLALTCIFVFILTWYYEVPESAWALVTIWFVMYEYTTVGGVLTKSFLRFAGTAASAVYGVIIVYAGGNNPLINMIALIPGLFVYAYYFMSGDKTYIGTIGAVTLTIVLLNYNNIDTAILRVFNVLIGILGSMFMIRFFYPQYARNLIPEMQARWVEQLSGLLRDFLEPSKTLEQLKIDSLEYEHFILTTSPTYERYVNEAKMETQNAPYFIPHAVEALKQFKLLGRLVSIFISRLSTEEMRTHPWVRAELNKCLKELHIIHCKLVRQEEPYNAIAVMPVKQKDQNDEEELILEVQIIENKSSVEAILKDMQVAITLLGEEVNNIVLIYDLYDPIIKTE